MKQLTFEEAKRLSLIKWDILRKNIVTEAMFWDLICNHKELGHLINSCGFCERHKTYGLLWGVDCKNCELTKAGHRCLDYGSIFNKWADAEGEKQLLLAEQMYHVINNLQE